MSVGALMTSSGVEASTECGGFRGVSMAAELGSTLGLDSWVTETGLAAGEWLGDLVDVVSGPFTLPRRGDSTAEDLFDGRVLLRFTPTDDVGFARGLLGAGEPVEGFPDRLDCLDETETFLLKAPALRTLSAPALALDAERPKPASAALVGVAGCL